MRWSSYVTGWVTVAALGCLVGIAPAARADVFKTFDLAWSGASLGNNAVATGAITIDTTLLPNPGVYFNPFAMPSWVTSLSVTVSGASFGNGTAGLADFSGLVWDTSGASLDLTQELVGQSTPGGPWGTPNSAAGDFNLFGAGGTVPSGVSNFTLGADAGHGDQMLLTSFAPAAVPEPASLALLGAGLAAFGFFRRHRTA